MTHRFLILALAMLATSCTLGLRRKTTAVDGRKSDTALFVQVGGKGGINAPEEGGMMAGADNEKSFRDAAMAAATLGYFAGNRAVKEAEAAASTTKELAKTNAGTEAARISAAERTATTLGSNPEANTGAVNAVGELFKK